MLINALNFWKTDQQTSYNLGKLNVGDCWSWNWLSIMYFLYSLFSPVLELSSSRYQSFY